MPRYFFHVRTDTKIECDKVGLELPDLTAARDQAILGARDLANEMALRGRDTAGWTLDIANEAGQILERVLIPRPLPGEPPLRPIAGPQRGWPRRGSA
jgi:hypothetical protein